MNKPESPTANPCSCDARGAAPPEARDSVKAPLSARSTGCCGEGCACGPSCDCPAPGCCGG